MILYLLISSDILQYQMSLNDKTVGSDSDYGIWPYNILSHIMTLYDRYDMIRCERTGYEMKPSGEEKKWPNDI